MTQFEENYIKCLRLYEEALELMIEHPGDERYKAGATLAFSDLYYAIRNDVLEKHAQGILDELHGSLPF